MISCVGHVQIRRIQRLNWLLNKQEFEQLIEGSSVLEQVDYGVKVYLLGDRRVIKLFRIKRIFSASFVYPYSVRFARNARKLIALGIPSVVVERTFYSHHLRKHGVIYPLLEGKTFSGLLDTPQREEHLKLLASFVVKLHSLGIYFRSLHLGNVLLLEDGSLGLIDVGDMRFKHRRLTQGERVRNFRHLYRSADHSGGLRDFGYEPFVALYLQALSDTGGEMPGLEQKLIAGKK